MAKPGRKQTAMAYLRVNSTGQEKGHGYKRQAEAVAAYAKANGYRIVQTYRDAFTGTDAERPGLEQMIADMLGNGVRVVIVESMYRFARELAVQMALLANLETRGIALIAASTGQDATAAMSDDPMMRAMVQMQGVFAELDKRLLVRKLKAARDAKRKATGRCEGRKPYGTRPGEREVIERMRTLRRKPRGGERMSYERIAAVLNNEHTPTRTGKPWRGSTVVGILNRQKGQG